MLFPKWTNKTPVIVGAVATLVSVGVVAVFVYFISPYSTQVGYAPTQPVPYSHKLHAGDLGMDCRYCHNTVDKAGHAAVPPTKTCLNCHSAANPDGTVSTSSIHVKSEKLLPLHEAQASEDAIPWVRVHNLPDFVYFNHSIHVAKGMGCVSCHGRVDKMPLLRQAVSLQMEWCLECHRSPEDFVRPRSEIYNMEWEAEDQATLGARLVEEYDIESLLSCSVCHR
jgi:hypothetical protein